MKVTDLTKALKGKAGWVSISPDNKRIIAHAKTLKALVARLKKLGNPDGSIAFAPRQEFTSYVG